jgi:hypothetical protein
MATGKSKVTVDHDEIRSWAEERKGKPACVKHTGGEGDVGMLRIDFPGYSGEQSLAHISWDEWFNKFDESNLALLYQETTAGGEKSNFNKLVSRETAEAAEEEGHAERRGHASHPKAGEAEPRHPEWAAAARKGSSTK